MVTSMTKLPYEEDEQRFRALRWQSDLEYFEA